MRFRSMEHSFAEYCTMYAHCKPPNLIFFNIALYRVVHTTNNHISNVAFNNLYIRVLHKA